MTATFLISTAAHSLKLSLNFFYISGERQKGSSKEKDVRMSNIIAAKGNTPLQ